MKTNCNINPISKNVICVKCKNCVYAQMLPMIEGANVRTYRCMVYTLIITETTQCICPDFIENIKGHCV